MKTDDKTLIAALRILAAEIKTDDGVVNACITEAANRIEELCQQLSTLTKQRDALLEALRGFDNANSEWRKGFYRSELVRLVDEMKDVVTVEAPE